MSKQTTWARFPGDDELTMYLCMEHYVMGRADKNPDRGHRHWVLPPRDGCACIICRVAELEAELAKVKAQRDAAKKWIRRCQAIYCGEYASARGVAKTAFAFAKKALAELEKE